MYTGAKMSFFTTWISVLYCHDLSCSDKGDEGIPYKWIAIWEGVNIWYVDRIQAMIVNRFHTYYAYNFILLITFVKIKYIIDYTYTLLLFTISKILTSEGDKNLTKTW